MNCGSYCLINRRIIIDPDWEIRNFGKRIPNHQLQFNLNPFSSDIRIHIDKQFGCNKDLFFIIRILKWSIFGSFINCRYFRFRNLSGYFTLCSVGFMVGFSTPHWIFCNFKAVSHVAVPRDFWYHNRELWRPNSQSEPAPGAVRVNELLEMQIFKENK